MTLCQSFVLVVRLVTVIVLMETHAVKMTALMPEPAADSAWYGDPWGAISIPAQKLLVSSLPVFGLVAAYVAARFSKYLKVMAQCRADMHRHTNAGSLPLPLPPASLNTSRCRADMQRHALPPAFLDT